ncbi:MAG: hypothetical protein AAFR95_17520, partial [Bacteroidota bacterium]
GPLGVGEGVSLGWHRRGLEKRRSYLTFSRQSLVITFFEVTFSQEVALFLAEVFTFVASAVTICLAKPEVMEMSSTLPTGMN